MSEPTERWLPVVGYETCYEVSDLGRVRSLRRPHCSGRIIRPKTNTKGYPAVSLCMDGVARVREIHLLICQAFLGPAPAGLEIRHLNGQRKDARLANLRYGTRSENTWDRCTHGTCSHKAGNCPTRDFFPKLVTSGTLDPM